VSGGGVSGGVSGGGDSAVALARQLSQMKLIKRSLAAAADAFNQERKVAKGIEVLQDRGIVAPSLVAPSPSPASATGGGGGKEGDQGATPATPATPGLQASSHAGLLSTGDAAGDLARFLRVAAYLGLDKGKVGDFLGEKDPLSLAVLHEYANTFDFGQVPLVQALRTFLQGFQLPGTTCIMLYIYI